MNTRDRNTSAPSVPQEAQPILSPVKRMDAPQEQVRPPDLERWIQKVRQLPAVREDLVRRIKAEIAAGKYETPEKLDIAARRLLEDLGEG